MSHQSSAAMKLAAVALVAVVLVSMATAQLQTTFGNDKSLQRYLNNPTLVQRQIKCVLEDKECDDLGHKLKAVIPEVLNNNCRNCSPQQATNARFLVSFLQRNHPQALDGIVRRFRG